LIYLRPFRCSKDPPRALARPASKATSSSSGPACEGASACSFGRWRVASPSRPPAPFWLGRRMHRSTTARRSSRMAAQAGARIARHHAPGAIVSTSAQGRRRFGSGFEDLTAQPGFDLSAGSSPYLPGAFARAQVTVPSYCWLVQMDEDQRGAASPGVPCPSSSWPLIRSYPRMDVSREPCQRPRSSLREENHGREDDSNESQGGGNASLILLLRLCGKSDRLN